jgi:hypothetical protein
MRITLLQKPGAVTVKDFSANLAAALSALKGGLSASTNPDGFSRKGWTRIDVEGQDSEILLELISRELGRAQTDLSLVEMHGNYQGVVAGEAGGNLEIDIGIEAPKPLNVKVKLSSLRAQLTDGRPLSGSAIAEDYCLYPDSRAAIRITRLEPDANIVEGCLEDSQISMFSKWVASRLDRIQVFDCFRQELESAIRSGNLERDIISVDPMSLTMHSVECKLGTDAIGLMPKLGSILRKRKLKPFLPRRILARCRQW